MLIALLHAEGDAGLRRAACYAIGSMGADARKAVPSLKQALKDDADLDVRLYAAQATVDPGRQGGTHPGGAARGPAVERSGPAKNGGRGGGAPGPDREFHHPAAARAAPERGCRPAGGGRVCPGLDGPRCRAGRARLDPPGWGTGADGARAGRVCAADDRSAFGSGVAAPERVAQGPEPHDARPGRPGPGRLWPCGSTGSRSAGRCTSGQYRPHGPSLRGPGPVVDREKPAAGPAGALRFGYRPPGEPFAALACAGDA